LCDHGIDKDDVEERKKPKIIGDYKIGKVLGMGSYGHVRLAVHVTTGEQFAIKTMKDAHNKKQIQREISILKLLDHPNIVKLYDVIEDAKSGICYLVLELAAGGELFDYIVARGRLREKEARKFFRQIISGVEYCHSNLVIHRDLKPENLLLDNDGNIKINDFGFSNIMVPGERFSTFCGSVSYVAPEIIKNIKYVGPEIDIWSMGVILYTLVCGRLPWPETNDGSPAIANIIEADYDVVPLRDLSEACRDLIAKILNPVPTERVTLAQIRQHAWVNEGYSGPPACLVHEFPPVVNVNDEILAQLLKIGFEGDDVIRSRLLSNERCPEVAAYNLLMQKYYPQERPLSATASLNPTDSDDNIGMPDGGRGSGSAIGRIGSGSTRKTASKQRVSKRMSGVPTSPPGGYGAGYSSQLEGMAAAMQRRSDTEPPAVVNQRRNTMASEQIDSPTSYARRNTVAAAEEVSSPDSRFAHRLSLGLRNSGSPPPKPSLNGGKRASVIITLGDSFKSLFKTSDKIKEVKGIFSVDTTTSAPPSLVVEEIMRVLDLEKDNAEEFRLKFKQKGYVFKCRYPYQHLEFTLEVCKIRKMDLTGVKSKRLKGDLWVYKDYCQRIITKLRL